IIVIDPGHGGFDPGAIGPNGLQEKVVNLNIALKLKEILNNKGYNVLLTRDDDEYISLQRRVEIAKEEKAMIFISIHNNSSRKSHTGGSEVYVSKNYKKEDMELANLINNNLRDRIKLDDRGIKQDNFYVIKNTIMPSVLVEVAFLSNPREESLLESDLFINKAANGIAEGVFEFLKKVK
ncbi:MAG: N-acetylmuramoyl-L-alanine amidase family protein, partial [Bacillota bacterium]